MALTVTVKRLLHPHSYQCLRTISTFPTINPPPAARSHGNRDINMELYASVRARREWVWSRDRAVSATPREGRKLTTRERVDLLRDPGSEVMHIGTLAGLGMPYGDVINASMEVVIATVCGELCLVSGNDWIFKGGTIYPIGVKKQLRGQEIARQNNLPCIYLADSGGAFLPLQAGLYPDKEHGGRVFRNQAVMSSLGIPQVAVVVGPCTAGGAYIPAMSDEAVIVQDIGTLYLAGPPLVRAATGARISAEELGGASVHCSISGCTDHYAETEEEAFLTVRAIVESLNLQQRERSLSAVEEPHPSGEEEWAELIPAQGLQDFPLMEVLSRLVDGGRLQPFKECYGPGLCTGFARISGYLVGVVANLGPLEGEEGQKAAHFIRLCTLRSLPLVFFVNTTSDPDFVSPVGTKGLTAKGHAQMIAALAAAHVPKITVVVGGAYGPGYYAMCGRPMEPNFLFHWPHARSGWAEPDHLLASLGDEVIGEQRDQYLSQFEREASTAMTSDLCHDGVILPSETRQVLTQCLDICTRYSSHTPPAHMGTVRM